MPTRGRYAAVPSTRRVSGHAARCATTPRPRRPCAAQRGARGRGGCRHRASAGAPLRASARGHPRTPRASGGPS